ncbi:ABC transporter permease [Colwelliaceae bacterium 6471]
MKHFINSLKFELILAKSALLKVPGISATIIATLAITLGALICVFSLNHLLLVKELPYPDADKLNVLYQSYTEEGKTYGGAQSAPGMILWYKNQQVFSELALIRDSTLLIGNHPEQPTSLVAAVTPEYFSLLAPQMHLGRTITQDEGFDQHQPVAVLSFETWQTLYHRDSNIIGKYVELGSNSFRVIGVTAQNFHPPANRNNQALGFWVPWDYQNLNINNWGIMTRGLIGIGKLKPGISTAQATASLSAQLNEKYVVSGAAESGDSAGAKLTPLKDVVIGDSQKIALLLLSGVVGLLLIASTNVTNLFLSRAAEKQRTMAIQAALGAKPRHLFISMFAESLILCAIAGLLGLIIAGWGFVLLTEMASEQLPRIAELGINTETIAFSVTMVIVLAGIFAKLSSRVVNYHKLQTQLQSSGKGSGIQISTKIRHLLITIQITLASLLLVSAVVVIQQSMSTVLHPLGFNEKGVTYFRIDNPKNIEGSFGEKLIKLNLLTLDIKNQLSLLPQVEQVSRSIEPIISKGVFAMNLNDRDNKRVGSFLANMVDENYFNVFELPIIKGRTFTPQTSPEYDINEIILSESLAQKLVPNGEALGNIYHLNSQELKVVGIVKDYYHPGQSIEATAPQYYLPYAAFGELGFEIKLKSDATITRTQILAILAKIDPKLKIRKLTTYSDEHATLIYQHKLAAGLTMVLALLALLLAAAGIYGVLSYSTQMRRYELGIHLALGAKTHRIIKMILRENLTPVFLGLGVSGIITILTYMLLRQELTVTIELNILAILSTIPIMLFVALSACYLPAQKVVNEDPVKALRNE